MALPAVEQWTAHEITLAGPAGRYAWTEVSLGAWFYYRNRKLWMPGFYDGDGVYRIRFMPHKEGDWEYVTESSDSALHGKTGGFRCTPAQAGNHGPVRVADQYHFAYADGTPYVPVGTTCYSWVHQSEPLRAQTLQTLAHAPFNKVRMMLMPKYFKFCRVEPPHHMFLDGPPKHSRMAEFNCDYFRNLETHIAALQRMGIEADLIFFTSYDSGHWGYDRMPSDVDERIIKYTVARLGAYRNVWWSLANEWDLMDHKTDRDWERYIQSFKEQDPYNHLTSIHNAGRFYDHTHPTLSHVSLQASDSNNADRYRARWRKPVVFDECCYEGDTAEIYGNLTAEEMTQKFWEAWCQGGYAGHGEMYVNPEEVLWWSKGGTLHGESPRRIAFLRSIMEDAPARGLTPVEQGWNRFSFGAAPPDYYILYFGSRQPSRRTMTLPAEHRYRVDVIDTWRMNIECVHESVCGECEVALPARPYMAIRAKRIR